MKKMHLGIFISFFIGVFSRYFFFCLYSALWTSVLHSGYKERLIKLFPNTFSQPIFLMQTLLENFVIAFIIIIIPSVYFGYKFAESKKQCWIYSISSLFGIVCFDIFYYLAVIDNVDFLKKSYWPVWYATVLILMWIFLFFCFYSFGRCGWHRQGLPVLRSNRKSKLLRTK